MRAEMINFLTQAAAASSLLFIPIFAKDLGASDLEIGLISAAYSFSFFLSSSIFGRLSDIYDQRKIVFFGLSLASIFFLLQSFASNSVQLLVFRFLLGISLGIFPAALISYVYIKKGYLGNFSASGSLGWAVGQLLAGIIAFYQGIFILGAIFTAISIFFVPREMLYSLKSRRLSISIIKKNFSVYFAFFPSTHWCKRSLAHLSNLSISTWNR